VSELAKLIKKWQQALGSRQ